MNLRFWKLDKITLHFNDASLRQIKSNLMHSMSQQMENSVIVYRCDSAFKFLIRKNIVGGGGYIWDTVLC